MTRIAYTALASGLALITASPAMAALTINIDTGSGAFSNPQLTCAAGVAAPCSFSDTATFTTPIGFNLASFTISSSQTGGDPATNVDFSTVTLNGVPFSTIATGIVEFRQLLNQTLTAGATNTLTVSGLTGANASYSGAISFAAATPAVPEAATWSMMIAGLGATGYLMRRRKTATAAA